MVLSVWDKNKRTTLRENFRRRVDSTQCLHGYRRVVGKEFRFLGLRLRNWMVR